jgi:hypothetical protein
MPMMTTLSLDDLRTKPVATISANIGNWIKDNFTRRQILEFLFEVPELADEPICTYNGMGKQTSQTNVFRDLETGNQSKKIVITWTYYPTTCVNEIETKVYGIDDEEISHKKVKHFKDVKPPEEIE